MEEYINSFKKHFGNKYQNLPLNEVKKRTNSMMEIRNNIADRYLSTQRKRIEETIQKKFVDPKENNLRGYMVQIENNIAFKELVQKKNRELISKKNTLSKIIHEVRLKKLGIEKLSNLMNQSRESSLSLDPQQHTKDPEQIEQEIETHDHRHRIYQHLIEKYKQDILTLQFRMQMRKDNKQDLEKIFREQQEEEKQQMKQINVIFSKEREHMQKQDQTYLITQDVLQNLDLFEDEIKIQEIIKQEQIFEEKFVSDQNKDARYRLRMQQMK